jgi:hypothetical protein
MPSPLARRLGASATEGSPYLYNVRRLEKRRICIAFMPCVVISFGITLEKGDGVGCQQSFFVKPWLKWGGICGTDYAHAQDEYMYEVPKYA